MTNPANPNDSIEPLGHDEAVWYLRNSGVPERDAGWLASLLLTPGVLVFGNREGSAKPDSDLQEAALGQAARVYKKHADNRDAAVLAVAKFVMGFHPVWWDRDHGGYGSFGAWGADRSGETAIVGALQDPQNAVDVAGGLVALVTVKQGDDGHLIKFARRLSNIGLVDPASVTRFLHWDVALKAREPQWSGSDLADPRRIEFWAQILQAPVVSALVAEIAGASDADAGPRALAVTDAIRNLLGLPVGNRSPKWLPFAAELRSLHAELDRRSPERGEHPALRQAWWRCAWRAYWGHAADLREDQRARLLASATEAWGRIRPTLNRADRPESVSEFTGRREELEDALLVLALLGGTWEAMKPLLLALRALPVAAVGQDLRPWYEPDLQPPPQPWVRIVDLMSAIIDSVAPDERAADPTLLTLRSHFAEFCAERLQSRKGSRKKAALASEDLVERDPAWRVGYVMALRDLQVNPEVRAHRTVFHTSRHDPDPLVREAATEAYPVVQSAGNGPPNIAPIRALHRATWHLRRAHREALGLPVDDVGARRTHAKEVRAAGRKEAASREASS